MNVRTQRRLCWLTAAALGAATAALWWLGLQDLGDGSAAWAAGTSGGSHRGMSREVASPSVDRESTNGVDPLLYSMGENSEVWEKVLRGPLYDPPPPPPPEIVPPPPLRLKLLGTIVEPGRSEAIVSTAAGQIEMARVGMTLDKATIRTIEDGQITVEYYDQTLTLEPQP